MGLFDKVFKRVPKIEEVTKGGSHVYQYGEKEFEGWRPPEEHGVYAEEINQYFKALYPNREELVHHELISDLIHIDVNIMKPTEDDPFYVLYTTGMSDLPMNLPEEISEKETFQFGELFMYLPDTWNYGGDGQLSSDIPDSEYWPIHLIKYLARFPHEYETWLGWGHTIPNGPEYAPLCEDTEMGGVVIGQLNGEFEAMEADDGNRINFFMVIPAYREEIEYKLEHGMSALDKRFGQGGLPLILDIHRPNYCKDI
jgi:hypothetical protein